MATTTRAASGTSRTRPATANAGQSLTALSIAEASALISRRKLSPVELTQAYLDRIQALDGTLKTYVTLTADGALADARRAEREVMRGRYRGPLHGVPLAHKDLYDTKGVRTTGQSKVMERRVPTEDATAITRLRRAGSVMLGKLAMFEFALGGPETSLFDQARNPWNVNYQTGGSSSGSGAAVAAALCAGSLGSDTGGSIRGPAGNCGIVGLKPTYGRVSRYAVLPLAWSLDHVGPMTRTVEDAALMLQAIAGHDAKDPTSARHRVDDYTAGLGKRVRGLTIGVPWHYVNDAQTNVAPDVAQAFAEALRVFERLGAKVREVTVPGLAYATIANQAIMVSEAFTYHLANLRSRPQDYGQIVRRRFLMGAFMTPADYVRAQAARSRVRREVAEVLRTVDIIATPTAPRASAALKGADVDAMLFAQSFMGVFNLTGLPAVSVPCGFSADGMPVGLQLGGRPFDEATVLRVAHAYEREAGWYTRGPAIG